MLAMINRLDCQNKEHRSDADHNIYVADGCILADCLYLICKVLVEISWCKGNSFLLNIFLLLFCVMIVL